MLEGIQQKVLRGSRDEKTCRNSREFDVGVIDRVGRVNKSILFFFFLSISYGMIVQSYVKLLKLTSTDLFIICKVGGSDPIPIQSTNMTVVGLVCSHPVLLESRRFCPTRVQSRHLRT